MKVLFYAVIFCVAHLAGAVQLTGDDAGSQVAPVINFIDTSQRCMSEPAAGGGPPKKPKKKKNKGTHVSDAIRAAATAAVKS